MLLLMRERKHAAEYDARMGYFAFRNIAPLNFNAKGLHTMRFNYHLVGQQTFQTDASNPQIYPVKDCRSFHKLTNLHSRKM